MTPEERIAAALAVLDKPRAVVADLASVNEAIAILRGEDGLRAGEWTAEGFYGPLSAAQMTAARIAAWLRADEAETIARSAEVEGVAPEDALAHAIEQSWVRR